MSIAINFKNISNKTIDRVTFDFHFCNSSGSTLRDTSDYSTNQTVTCYTDLAPGRSGKADWDYYFYNSSARQLHIDEVTVYFADGTSQEMYCNTYWYWS